MSTPQRDDELANARQQGYREAIDALIKLNPGLKIILSNTVDLPNTDIDEKTYCVQLKELLKNIRRNENFIPPQPTKQLADVKMWNVPRFDIEHTCYIYLLLDADILKAGNYDFLSFILALFYVGKGSALRLIGHFKETMRAIKNERKFTDKTTKIDELWNSGKGVHVLQIFELIGSDEALVHEACMIQAIEPLLTHEMHTRPVQLVNQNPGTFHDDYLKWSWDEKMQLPDLTKDEEIR